MTPLPTNLQNIEQAAARLAGEAVIALEAAGIGANSRMFRVTTAKRTLALKCYPHRPGDMRDRLDVEWKALKFMQAQSIDPAPSALARDDNNRLMLMEWLEGQRVAHHNPADLNAAIDFMTQIFIASDAPQAADFPMASQACLSAAEIVRQINQRLAAFSSDPVLDTFLAGEFRPRFQSACAALGAEIDEKPELPRHLRRLIPADFGFHNALRDGDGDLRFFDFDYFGWDDPVKLTADFLLHPAMSLSKLDKQLVVQRLAAALPQDKGFLTRLNCHKPLYALRWALILLNPFRRDRLTERPRDDSALKSLVQFQIEKAQHMCLAADI